MTGASELQLDISKGRIIAASKLGRNCLLISNIGMYFTFIQAFGLIQLL
tara:strand:+ start:861 stop:1007 length:147 start_codon:yes stop_codon:yes gene_type:complete